MSWSAITEADLVTQISGAELAALRAAALADEQVDPVAPSIALVTAKVLGFVSACEKNTLDADKTKIPNRLKGDASIMVVAEIIGRVPGYKLDDKKQRRLDEALRTMRDVAACAFAIEDPTTGADRGAGAELAQSSTRRMGRAQLDGL